MKKPFFHIHGFTIVSPIVLIILIGLTSCKSNLSIPGHIREMHEKVRNAIDKYLQSIHTSKAGFDGEVFCTHELLGGEESQLFLLAHCQEYYAMADTLKEGTGYIRPISIEIKNQQIFNHVSVGDGSQYADDIEKIFPPRIVSALLDSEFKSRITNRLLNEMDTIKKAHHASVSQRYRRFLDIFEKRKPADFYAWGTEPFWTIFLVSDTMMYHENGRVEISKLLDRFDPSLEQQTINYENSKGDIFSLEIKKEWTSLEESMERHPYAVIRDSKAAFLNGVGDTAR